MLSADELASIQAVAESSLPDSGTILRRVQVADTMGGFSETWPAIGTAACRLTLAKVQPFERVTASRPVSIMAWVVTFPSGTDVAAADRITCLSHTFEVTAPLGPVSSEAIRRVQCVEVL